MFKLPILRIYHKNIISQESISLKIKEITMTISKYDLYQINMI